MSKTNVGLVNYAKAQIGKPYWYGTFGNTATEALLESKKAQYPSHYQYSRMSKYKSQIGKRVHDCVGLIKGYLWSDSPTSAPKYKSSQDVSANGMLKVCTEKGKIATIPEIPGVLVFLDGHVGVYEGNGKVIEARGFNYGVVRTNLKDRPWTNWGKCPWIIYPSSSETSSTVKPSVTKKSVSEIAKDIAYGVGEWKNCFGTERQKKLKSMGYNPAEVQKEVNKILEADNKKNEVIYFPRFDGKTGSIVDALKSMGINSSFSNRKKIATANGIKGYVGTPEQNTKLLIKLMAGKLIKP